MLRQQRQFAEPRTIRRIHGVTVSGNDHVNAVVDCVLYFALRLQKGWLRLLHGRSLREPQG